MRRRSTFILACLSVFLPLLPLAAPARAAILRVRAGATGTPDGTTWATAYPSIQAAVTASAPGDEVWLARGTYRGTLALNTPGIALYGGFDGTETERAQRDPEAHITILDAEKKGRVITITAVAEGAVVDGLNIRFGFAGRYGDGGGILSLAPNVTIAHNTLMANIAVRGGGLYAEAEGLTVDDNIFWANEAYFREDTPEAYGGGICLRGGSAVIRANTFRFNIAHTDDMMSFPQWANVTIAYGGGICTMDARVDLRDNVFYANKCIARPLASRPYHAGSGIFGLGGVATIANNTFIANELESFFSSTMVWDYYLTGGALVLYQPIAGTVVANNILAFNGTGYAQIGGHTSFHHNNVFANTGGNYYLVSDPTGVEGNISADPLFLDRAAGNYRLNPASPSVDAGDTGVTLPDQTDRDGNPRVQGLRVDMGAYESAITGQPTLTDARVALAVAAGLQPLDPSWLPRLNTVDPATTGIDLLDALYLARQAGL